MNWSSEIQSTPAELNEHRNRSKHEIDIYCSFHFGSIQFSGVQFTYRQPLTVALFGFVVCVRFFLSAVSFVYLFIVSQMIYRQHLKL